MFNQTARAENLLNQDYISVWEFEKTVNEDTWLNRFRNNPALPFYICSAYVLAVFTGQKIMQNYKPLVLKKPLAVWNFLLAGFSLVGTIRTVPELFQYLKQENGFHLSVCSREFDNQATAFWLLLIILSKAVELGDTVFVVLRKKPLIFLHWGHHVVALLYTWSTYPAENSNARWFMIMNFFVHSIMYFYFGLRALEVQVPKGYAIAVTFCQTLQMFLGTIVGIHTLYSKYMGVPCHVNQNHAYLGLVGYSTFFFLFSNFFVNAYLRSGKRVKKLHNQ